MNTVRGLAIGIDYDDTISTDTEAWGHVIQTFASLGAIVYWRRGKAFLLQKRSGYFD